MQKIKALIIEDEPRIPKLICIHLQRAGYFPIQAFNSKDGMTLFEKHNPDLVVVDQTLGGVGHLLADELHERSNGLVRLVMIFQSGIQLPPEYFGEWSKARNNLVYNKPFSPDELITIATLRLPADHWPQKAVAILQAVLLSPESNWKPTKDFFSPEALERLQEGLPIKEAKFLF